MVKWSGTCTRHLLIVGEEEWLHDAGEDPVLPVLQAAAGHVPLKKGLLPASPGTQDGGIIAENGLDPPP